MSIPTVTLVSGIKVPRLAFGVGTALYKSDCSQQVETAIKAGFTHLDHAEVYANSEASGRAIGKHLDGGASRESLFILTKLMQRGILDPMSETKREIELLQCRGYADAVLLHRPPRGENGLPSNVEAWKLLEEVKDKGLARVIGVSNWMASDIEEVVASKPKHPIEINQIELNPSLYHHPEYQALLKVHKRENIKAMVYGSLTSLYKDPERNAALNKALEDVAAKHNTSSTAVLQSWVYARTDGLVVTTTSKESRARAYVEDAVKDEKLSEQELAAIEEAARQSPPLKYYMTDVFDPSK